jgi:hypothetical protein
MNRESNPFELPPEDDPMRVPDYRPFNPLSLLAFLLALLGLLSITSNAFVAPGILALVVGFIAAKRCDGGRRMTGYRIAMAALFLAALGLAMGVGHRTGRNYWLVSIARSHAETMFDYLKKDWLEELVSIGAEPGFRPESGVDLVEWYERTEELDGGTPPPVVTINFWMSIPPWREMIADELNGTHRYIAAEELYVERKNLERLVLRYRYEPANPRMNAFDYLIQFQRYDYQGSPAAHWRAWMVAIPPKAGDPVPASIPRNLEPRKRIRRADPGGQSLPAPTG